MKVNKLLADSSIYVILSFFQKGISFLLIPFYTFFLSPAEFGKVNQIIALHSIYILVIMFSLNESLAKWIAPKPQMLIDKVKINIVVLNLILVIIGIIILYFFNQFFYDYFIYEIGWDFKILSFLIVGSSPIFFIYQKYLRMLNKSINYAYFMLINIGLQVFFSLLLIYVYELGAKGYLMSIAFTSVIYAIYCYSKLVILKVELISFGEMKKHFLYSSKLIPHSIAGWGMNGFTNVLLGNFTSLFAVGIFNAVNIVGVMINVISKSVLDAFQPWIYAQLSKKNGNKLSIKYLVKILSILIVLMGICVISIDDFILKIFLDKSYYEGIKYAPFLVLNSVLLAIGSMTVYVIYYYENEVKYVSISTITGAIINILLGYFMIKEFGLIGAIVSLTIANLIISIIKIRISAKILSNSYNLKELFLIIILVALISFFYEEYSLYFNIFSFLFLSVKLYLLFKKITTIGK